MIRARGGLMVADQGNRAIAIIDLKTKQKTQLADRFEGKRFNSPNDMVLHPNGMIFFTDPPFGLNNVFNSPDRELDYTGVFRLNPDNTVTLIDKTLRPNGIGLSPDGSKLYCHRLLRLGGLRRRRARRRVEPPRVRAALGGRAAATA